ncbi:hypothetical protein KC850_01210 [Candidatus Kaiserbacteria bacterium]|nr:hypothetical protein [Candidatus Kaiserbacteria bacterium]MCB9817899.1 hypothetical protein [Candidatus Nomurabacteria bacterium]
MNEETNEVKVPNFEGEEMKMPENTDAQIATEESSSVINGPLLFSLAILLIVILGGMYFWFNSLDTTPAPTVTSERPSAEENNEPESTTAEAQTDTMLTTSTSDEISAIEADIEATNLESLDAELDAIDAELEAAVE